MFLKFFIFVKFEKILRNSEFFFLKIYTVQREDPHSLDIKPQFKVQI